MIYFYDVDSGELDSEEAEAAVDDLDTDDDGLVNAQELVLACQEILDDVLDCPENEEEAQALIDEYDTDGDGKLSASELQAAANDNNLDQTDLDETDNTSRYGIMMSIVFVIGLLAYF